MNVQHVRELLPFFVNGTLSEIENARVVRHLASCASCHEDLDEQRRLQDLVRAAPAPAVDAQSAWARLERTLDAESHALAPSRWVRPSWLSGLGLAAAAAMVLWFAPMVLVDPGSGAADYRTLTSASPDSVAGRGTIRAVFASRATAGDIGDLLDRTGLQIVSGPSSRGVYTLAPGADATASHDALAALRASPLVALAEPVDRAPAGQ